MRRAGSGRSLFVKVGQSSVPTRREHEALPIRRPDRPGVWLWREGEPLVRPTREIEEPDVAVACHGDPTPVWGQHRVFVATRRSHRAQLGPRPVHPPQLRQRGSSAAHKRQSALVGRRETEPSHVQMRHDLVGDAQNGVTRYTQLLQIKGLGHERPAPAKHEIARRRISGRHVGLHDV